MRSLGDEPRFSKLFILSDAPLEAFCRVSSDFARRLCSPKKFTPLEMKLDRLRRNGVILPQLNGWPGAPFVQGATAGREKRHTPQDRASCSGSNEADISLRVALCRLIFGGDDERATNAQYTALLLA